MSLRVLLALIRHPSLWAEAVRALWAVRCKEWRSPLLFVPMFEREYLRWRIGTAYGDPDAGADPDDVVAFLRWRRQQRLS
jgi:hypothetical protein